MIRSLSVFSLMVLLIFGGSFSARAELVLYLPFEEVDGQFVEDASSKGNIGEIFGPVVRVDGKEGRASKLDEVALFDHTLTAVEVEQIFQHGIEQAGSAVQPDDKLATMWATLK